jgi:hypothetical protein
MSRLLARILLSLFVPAGAFAFIATFGLIMETTGASSPRMAFLLASCAAWIVVGTYWLVCGTDPCCGPAPESRGRLPQPSPQSAPARRWRCCWK